MPSSLPQTNLFLLCSTFIVSISFVSLLLLPKCYTPWSVFQDGIIKMYSSHKINHVIGTAAKCVWMDDDRQHA